MLRSKKKDFFIDITESDITYASVVWENGVGKLTGFEKQKFEDIRESRKILSRFYGPINRPYIPSFCCVHFRSEFVRKVTIDAPLRIQDSGFMRQYLLEEYSINSDESYVQVLNGSTGKRFNPEEAITKELIICGANSVDLKEEQEKLLALGCFPVRLELGSMTTLGGLLDYAAEEGTPTIFLDLGQNASQVFIFHKGQIHLIRSIPFGVNSMVTILQEELGLEDEGSSRKLLFSKTFDFKQNSKIMLDKILKELQTSIDYFEVQTGQTVGTLYVGALPEVLRWIEQVTSETLGLRALSIDYGRWLEICGIELKKDVNLISLDTSWFNIFSMLTAESVYQMGGV